MPSSCITALPGTMWRPLTGPVSYYPWSILWRSTDTSDHVRAMITCARVPVSAEAGAAETGVGGSGRFGWVWRRARWRSWMMRPVPGMVTISTPAVAASSSAMPKGQVPVRAQEGDTDVVAVLQHENQQQPQGAGGCREHGGHV